MGTKNIAAAMGTAVLLYLVLSGRLSVEDAEERRLLKEASKRTRIERKEKREKKKKKKVKVKWPEKPPVNFGQALGQTSRALRYTWKQTLGQWTLGEIAFGIKYYMKQQGNLQHEYTEGNSILLGHDVTKELVYLLRHLKLCMFFSKKPYKVFMEHGRYSDDDVLVKKHKARLLRPSFTVVRDGDTKCFLLLIRGAISVKERLTAATGAAVPFHHVVMYDGAVTDVVLGHAHCGMVAAARWIAKCAVPALTDAVRKHPDYNIKIIGHSMGAAIASILTYMLREHKEFASCTCIAYGPAACMTWELAESGKDFITSLVNRTDVVPSFSLVSAAQLRAEVPTMVAMHEVLSLTPFLTSLLALLLVSPIIIYLLKPRNHGLPPAPPAIPIIGHLHLLKPPMHITLHELTTRYGPLIHLRLGSSLSIVTRSVDMAREVLKTHDTIFSERPSTVAARKFAYETAGFAFAPYGEYWRFIKRLCMSELLGPRTLEQLRPIRQSEVAFLLRGLLEKSRVGEAVNLSKELIKLTNNIITRMVASSTAGDEADMSRRVVKQVAEVMGTFNAEDYIGFLRGLDIQGLNKKIREVHRNFDNLLEGFITAKEKSRNKVPERGSGEAKETPVKDLLDILLDVAGDPTAEVKITRENIKAFILDIFTAGTDSSASTIEWTLSELINHPKIMEKLREEIDGVIGRDRVVGEADVPNLPYLNAVVKEIMRIHPAAPIAYRISTKETIIGGYTIPANTTAAVNLYSTGRDPKYWVNPDEFRPERFFEESNSNLDVKGLHYQLIPFGSGRRVCPGIGFALQVVPAALAALVQCFEWKIDEGTANENGKVDMEEGDGGLVSYRAKPLVVVPIPRLNPFPLN